MPTIQMQGVFITELAIEIGNACDRLKQVALGLATRVQFLEKRATQPTMAVGGSCRHKLRTPHA